MTTERLSLVQVGDELYDEESGEFVEIPRGADRLAWLQDQHLFARAQESRWGEVKGIYARLIERELDGAGLKKLTTDRASSSWVNGYTKETSEARALRDAVRVELLTDDEATALLIEAAKSLDPKAVRAWIDRACGDDEVRKERLLLVLVGRSEVRGHVLTRAAAVAAPEPRKGEPSDE